MGTCRAFFVGNGASLKTKSADLKSRLRALLAGKSVCREEVTLASGAKSNFYVDSKMTTLDPEGAWLVGKLGWELVKAEKCARKTDIKAIGGLTMGADPIALAVSLASWDDDQSNALQTFVVRKEPKKHGRHKLIEGNFKSGQSVVIVDDVITTGESAIKAIRAVEEAGGKIAFVLVLVDRQEGGRENIERCGAPVRAIFTRADLTGTHVQSHQSADCALA